jgi:cholesterol transport system auxiliary component
LREQLGQTRPVLDPTESAALARIGGAMPRVLRIEVEEFSQLFDSPGQSWGLLRLRATLLENTPAGEKLLGQRNIVKREQATSADAPGGVRALAAATDAAAAEINQWLLQTP